MDCVDFGTELRVTKTASEGPAWHIVISVKRGMFCRRKEIDENYPRSIFNLKTPHITRLAKATGLGQVFTGTFNLTSIFLEDFAGFLQGFRFTLPVAISAGTDLP